MIIRRAKRAALAALFGLALAYTYTLGPAMLPVESRVPWPAVEGGLSGLDLDGTGGFVAVSDTGLLHHGQLDRDEAGRLTGVRIGTSHRLLDRTGALLVEDTADAEDVSLWGDQLLISYENPNRVWVHTPRGGPGRPLPDAPPYQALWANLGFESVTALPGGGILLLAERLIGGAPIWVFDGTWRPEPALRSRPLYAATAADTGPDGRIYVLERAFLGIGFAARVRRLDHPGAQPDTVLTLPLWRTGNAEGLAVSSAGPDHLRLTIITDNNNRPRLQRSEITDVLLPNG